MKDFPQIAPGSIIKIWTPGSRSTDGEARQIPAIVLAQWPEDGALQVFCFHFEGTHHAVIPVQTRTPAGLVMNVEVQFDASGAIVQSETDIRTLREIVANDILTLQRQMAEFKEEVLGMMTAPDVTDTPEGAARVASTRNRR